ncbi:hypothetical protein O181_070190 [Austropuccinia psidii MF-1]|uniref:Uncharacterized protein n=1 Tax=Austropuccinia psidii MF-1 TaxID=1389203 RepID=A0A9Q3EVZ1_9BASI|nr:hypothetical protein [Austropuccinia psidii MF-1]
MIQTLKDMVRKLCAYGLEFKDCYRFAYDWCDSLPKLEFVYETSIHAGTNQNTAILKKGWNPKLTQDLLRKDLVEIHPSSNSFKGILKEDWKHKVRWMEDSFAYAKNKLD